MLLALLVLGSTITIMALHWTWSARISVSKKCIEVLYSSGSIEADAAPYQTLFFSMEGLVEQTYMPSAYKLFTIELNSDRVNITLSYTVHGAYSHAILFYVTTVDIDPLSLRQWGRSVELVPENNTVSIVLEKTRSKTYYIWIDGWIKTAENDTVVDVHVEMTAQPIP